MLPFELTKDTPYLALSGGFCEYFNRNWPCYKGFLLYIICFTQIGIHNIESDVIKYFINPLLAGLF